MLTILDCATQDPFAVLKKRTIHRDDSTERVVKEIIEDVRTRGDLALLENARKFDSPDLESILVTDEDMGAAVAEPYLAAILESARRVRKFYAHQFDTMLKGHSALAEGGMAWNDAGEPWLESHQRNKDSSWLGQKIVPVRAAGVYVPGGNASYPSSVIMNAIPAQAAGVNQVVVTTPVQRSGSLHPAVLVALRECGITQVFKIGGAAAIAALALGTESVPRVDKIVGPGNRFVNEAKRQLWGTVGLDGYAGPSEVCVLVDDQANAKFAAADLLTQIEHAPDNAAFLVTVSRAKLDEILAEVEVQLKGAQREETMRTALKNESMAFIARDMAQACEIVDAIAPEHLTLATSDPERTMESIHNAGCILLGEWTPESAGDFCLGPSHTLPTSGAARFGSPVNVLDFLKVQSVSRLTREGLQALTPTIEAFGEMEGFPTHGRGASIRFEE